MREGILQRIKEIARENGGRAPGKAAFTRLSGIGEHQWSGVMWARWSDALAEAGYAPKTLQRRFDNTTVLRKIAEACRHYGHVPTVAEFKLLRLRDPSFPSKGAISGHFQNKAGLIDALIRFVFQDESYRDIDAMLSKTLPTRILTSIDQPASRADGFVYLIKSSTYYKIGRSDELERRVKETRIALPDAASLAHVIRTDDPPGIEAYWHRRFADRRANGEWFKLAAADIKAFKRRGFQ